MTTKPIYDLDKPSSDEKIATALKIHTVKLHSIFKSKLLEVSLVEIVTHIISLAVILLYIIILCRNIPPLPVYDTISKLVIGAYIGGLFRK